MKSYNEAMARTWSENRLFSVLLELTYRCNLDCWFCYNDTALVGRPLSREQYLSLLADLADLGVLHLTLSGASRSPTRSSSRSAAGRASSASWCGSNRTGTRCAARWRGGCAPRSIPTWSRSACTARAPRPTIGRLASPAASTACSPISRSWSARATACSSTRPSPPGTRTRFERCSPSPTGSGCVCSSTPRLRRAMTATASRWRSPCRAPACAACSRSRASGPRPPRAPPASIPERSAPRWLARATRWSRRRRGQALRRRLFDRLRRSLRHGLSLRAVAARGGQFARSQDRRDLGALSRSRRRAGARGRDPRRARCHRRRRAPARLLPGHRRGAGRRSTPGLRRCRRAPRPAARDRERPASHPPSGPAVVPRSSGE